MVTNDKYWRSRSIANDLVVYQQQQANIYAHSNASVKTLSFFRTKLGGFKYYYLLNVSYKITNVLFSVAVYPYKSLIKTY